MKGNGESRRSKVHPQQIILTVWESA